MIWWMWVIIAFAIIGLFVLIPFVLKVVGFSLNIIFRFIGTIIIFIVLAALITFIADACFDAGWWIAIKDWFNSIRI